MKPAQHRNNTRTRIILFLAFMTSPECQELCRKAAAPEAVAARLTRVWFDDLYVPGESYFDGLKGNVQESEVEFFESCFSKEELAILERFHGFFELRLDFLANSRHGRAQFPDNDSWRSLIRHADHVLSELAPNPDHIRGVVESLASQANDDVERVARALGQSSPFLA